MNLSTFPEHIGRAVTRRDILARAGHGFGAIALGSLLSKPSLLGKPASAAIRVNPLAAKPPNFAPKAKSVIFLFMVGGPSHIDTFDPKPALKKYEGPKAAGRLWQSEQPVHRRRHAAASLALEIFAARAMGYGSVDALSAPGGV